MAPSEIDVAAELVSRYAKADPIVAAVVAEAARFAPIDPNDADEAISSSRLFLGALDCTASNLEQGPLRDLRRAIEHIESGPAAISHLRSLFRRDSGGSTGVLSRLRAGLSTNASTLITAAGGDGRATEETLVSALLNASAGRLSKRMRESGVDLRMLRDAYLTLRRSTTQQQARGVPRIEGVRLAGLAAYAPLYQVLNTDAPEIWLRQFAATSLSEIRASIANLPAPDQDLPLRVLVSLAHEARAGSLEWFYGMAADGGRLGEPVSKRLREWLDAERQLLAALFPEVVGGTVRRAWESWTPPKERIPAGPGRFDWDMCEALANDLTRIDQLAAVGRPDQWLLLILIREGAGDLSPLLNQFDAAAIDRATDRIIRGMAAVNPFSEPRVDGASLSFLVRVSFSEMRQAERALAADLPVSAWTIFAVLIMRCPTELRDTFDHEFTEQDAQRILEQARKQLGLAPRGETGAEQPPEESFSAARPEARATRDFWTADDSLGYQPFADAIAGFIRHRETRPPFTIGIKAPWGSGKTSLMRMVQNALDPREDVESWKPKDIKIDPRQRLTLTHLDSTGAVEPRTALQHIVGRLRGALGWSRAETPREAKVWDLLERLTEPPTKDAVIVDTLKEIRPGIDEESRQDKSWRPTVWFNPWMYQTGEQTWAGLANEIITQIGDRLDPIDREWFWLQLNLRRLNRDTLRRRVHGAIFQRLIPGAIVAFIVLVLAVMVSVGSVVLPWLVKFHAIAAVLMPLSPLGLLIWGGYQWFAGLRRRVASVFPDLVEGPKAAERLGDIVKKGAEGLGEAFEDPGYGAKMGFLYLIQTDMKRVLDLIATKDQPLVVFVDDLDRCSPGTVAQVIEAVNLFLAGEFPNCIFVLAMEPDIVAAHVEVEHAKLVERLGSGLLAEEWTTLGWRFLDKIVQLPLSIPEPDDQNKLKPFLDALLGGVETSGKTQRTDHDSVQQQRTARPAVVGSITQTQAGGDAGNVPTSAPVVNLPAAPTTTVTTPTPTPVALRAAAAPLDAELVAHYVASIEGQELGLSIAAIRNAARAAQAARSGAPAEAGLSPEAVAAARQVFERLLSERNPTVRHAIESGIDLLGPRNPRQVKRFVNLFRFYAFIEAVRTFSAADDTPVADLTAVAKVAAIAIRWPSLVSALTRKSNGEYNLAVLEQGAAEGPAWTAALHRTGLVTSRGAKGDDEPNHRFDPLRDLLSRGPRTAALGRRLL